MRRTYLLLCIANKGNQIIRNSEYPSCKNCMYYKPRLLRDFTSPFSFCKKFGVKDIITDEITLDYVDDARKTETKCGQVGKYFEKERFIKMKIWAHRIFRPRILVIVPILYLLSYYIIFLK